MPPAPILLGSLSQVSVPRPFDCIKCNPPTNPIEAQRYRGAGDSKLLWSQPPFFPFRMYQTDDLGYSVLSNNPNKYWPLCAWGEAVGFGESFPGANDWGPQGVSSAWGGIQWLSSIGGPGFYHQWLSTCILWNSNDLTTYPNKIEIKVMQWLNATGSIQNYQIWRVTAREPLILSYADTFYNYTGYFPPGSADIWTAGPPWWASSDWALVSSGALQPLDTLTIKPFGSNPKSATQIPPAGCLADGVTPSSADGDWNGWGKLTFVAFV